MEQEIIKLLKDYGSDRIKLLTLIDLGDELDADLETYPIVCDMVEVIDGNVYIYDSADVDDNGDIEPIHKLSKLSESIQKEVKWTLIETLGVISK